VKGDARGMIIGGLAMLGFVTVALMSAAVRGAIGADTGFLLSQAVLATGGAAMVGFGAFRLPGWARLRRRQMEDVAARIGVVASTPPGSPPQKNLPPDL
jgi:hypothetical protein